jgi:hypothetical protein
MEEYKQILKELLNFHNENWDFESAKATYHQLAVLDDYYYIEFLIYLADHSFLSELSALINNNGFKFFKTYSSKYSTVLSEEQILSLNAILNWYSNIFIPISNKLKSIKNSKHEEYILTFIADDKIDELKDFVIKNSEDLFKNKICREMVIVYALIVLDQNKIFDESICKMALQLSAKKSRCTVVAKLIIKNSLNKNFFNMEKDLNIDFMKLLLHKIYIAKGSYGRQITKKIYSILGNNIEYINDKQISDFQNITENTFCCNEKKGIFNKLFLKYKSHLNNTTRIKHASRPRVAVCISGMTRGLNAPIKSLHENIVLPLNADVFLSTWDIMEIWPGLGADGETTNTPFVARVFDTEAIKYCPPKLDDRKIFSKIFPNVYSVLQSRKIAPLKHLFIRII